MREALFAILSSAGALDGARVLDLFAGTGALSLEALSRGAAHATMVESSREALAALEANVASLDLADRAVVLHADVGRAARRLAGHGPFDLVLADPPWPLVESGDAVRALASVLRAVSLSARALVVLEHAARTPAPTLPEFGLSETRRYGDTALSVYKPAILGPLRP